MLVTELIAFVDKLIRFHLVANGNDVVIYILIIIQEGIEDLVLWPLHFTANLLLFTPFSSLQLLFHLRLSLSFKLGLHLPLLSCLGETLFVFNMILLLLLPVKRVAKEKHVPLGLVHVDHLLHRRLLCLRVIQGVHSEVD